MKTSPDMLGRRQLFNIAFIAVLSPVIRLIPRYIVRFGGRAAWASAIFSLLPVYLFALFMNSLLKNRAEGEGLGDIFIKALGAVPGRAAVILYTLWLLFYAGFTLRGVADRFITTIYPSTDAAVFIVIMLALSLLAALGRLKTLARTADVLRPLLIFVLAVVLIFSASEFELKNMLPITTMDAPGVLLACVPIMDILGCAAYIAFLAGRTKKAPGLVTFAVKNAGVMLLIILGLCVSSINAFGPDLTVRMRQPFFVVLKNINLLNLLNRVEAAIITLWVASDFMMVSLLLFIASENLRLVFGLVPVPPPAIMNFSGGRLLIWLCAITVFAAALSIAPTSFDFLVFSERIVPLCNILFVFAGLPLIFAVGRLRGKI